MDRAHPREDVLNRLSIQSKMILLLLATTLGSIAAMAWIGYGAARDALVQSTRNQLQGVRVAKTRTLATMLESLRDQVVSISDSRAVIDGMRTFRKSYRELDSKTLSPRESGALEAFYRDTYLPALDAAVEGTPVIDQYLPRRPAERWLQLHWVATNPHPYGKGFGLAESPDDDSDWGRAHAALHAVFSRAVKIFGFEDVMLVDADTLDVVYTWQKTAELGTSLENGPYSNTQLAAKVRA
ncbi:hypothetical protein KGQ64_15855, partial [bacterium]|nr:hypothetical protein [bacterium]